MWRKDVETLVIKFGLDFPVQLVIRRLSFYIKARLLEVNGLLTCLNLISAVSLAGASFIIDFIPFICLSFIYETVGRNGKYCRAIKPVYPSFGYHSNQLRT